PGSSDATTGTMSRSPSLASAERAPRRALAIFSPVIEPDRSTARHTLTSGRGVPAAALAPSRLTRRKAVLRRPPSMTGVPRPASRTTAAGGWGAEKPATGSDKDNTEMTSAIGVRGLMTDLLGDFHRRRRRRRAGQT